MRHNRRLVIPYNTTPETLTVEQYQHILELMIKTQVPVINIEGILVDKSTALDWFRTNFKDYTIATICKKYFPNHLLDTDTCTEMFDSEFECPKGPECVTTDDLCQQCFNETILFYGED